MAVGCVLKISFLTFSGCGQGGEVPSPPANCKGALVSYSPEGFLQAAWLEKKKFKKIPNIIIARPQITLGIRTNASQEEKLQKLTKVTDAGFKDVKTKTIAPVLIFKMCLLGIRWNIMHIFGIL